MSGKRYFFKLEMEQLPDDIWQQLKSTDILKTMGFQDKSEIVELIDKMPEEDLGKLRHTVRAIRDEALIKYMKEHPENFEMALMSESSFAKDWLLPEEDEAWKDL